jgi:hypothetical protein
VAHGATSEVAPVPRLGRTTIERRPEPDPVSNVRSHVEEAAQASAGCYFFDHTTFTSTPEPSTVVLSVTGLMLIAGRAWRKRTPFERIVIFPILHGVHRSNHSAFVICSGVHRFITRIAELGTGECWRKGLLASRIFIPPEVYLQVRSPACVRLSFC